MQLKGYAQSQSAVPEIDNTYAGKAVEGNRVRGSREDLYGNFDTRIMTAVYVVPTVIVMLLLIGGFFQLLNHPLQEQIRVIKYKSTLQATILSSLLLCMILHVFMVVLDGISLYIETNSTLPSYYPNMPYSIYPLICVFLTLSGFVTSCSVVVFFIIIALYVCDCCDIAKIMHKCLAILAYLIVGSFFVSLTSHLPSILMAWATDPFYASRIGLYYLIVICLYYVAFYYSYILSYNTIYINEESVLKKLICCCYDKVLRIYPCNRLLQNKKFCLVIIVTISFIISFVSVSAIIATVTIFVASVPVNNSLESSTDSVTTIYNGVVVLIGGVVAYTVFCHYFDHSFSMEGALKQAMNELNDPFRPPEDGSDIRWEKLTEEKRLIQVMKALISNKTIKVPPYTTANVNNPAQSTPPSADPASPNADTSTSEHSTPMQSPASSQAQSHTNVGETGM